MESTILSVMRDHLRKERRNDKTGEPIVRQAVDDDQLWCDCTFDFHEATFHGAVDLTYSTLECVPDFRGTKFERGADFGGATFTRRADFGGATFTRGAAFDGATFTRDANFRGTTFTRSADFHKATFTRGAVFDRAEFRASATFSGIQGQPSFRFEECKFNERFRDDYEWGPIPILKENYGLPAGAVWAEFPEEDDKDGGTTSR